MTGKQRIRVDWDELIEALDSAEGSPTCFLDSRAGQVIALVVDEEEQERIALASPDDPLRALLDEQEDPDLPDEARRFRLIDPIHPSERYRIMEEFATQVKDASVQGQLLRALQGEDALQNFRTAIELVPEPWRERWVAHRTERMRAIAHEWLEAAGFEEKRS